MSRFKLTIEEKRSPHSMEREKRYSVKVNGTEVDELYYNMTGYNGSLMSVHGERVSVGERGISAWRKEMAALNREAREVLAATDADDRRLRSWEATARGDTMRLTFEGGGREEILHVSRRDLRAGHELLGTPGLSSAYFRGREVEDPGPAMPGQTLTGAETWDGPRFVMDILETTDPAWQAVVTGHVPAITGKVLSGDVGPGLDEHWDCRELAAAIEALPSDDWSDGARYVVFLAEEDVSAAVERNGRAFMRAERLPGEGIMSGSGAVFGPMITSTRQRPDLVLTEDQDRRYGELARGSGMRVAPPAACADLEETPAP